MVERITSLIKEKGTSINAVEKALGFGNGAIKRFSTCSPSIDKIMALAKYLNTSVEYILTGNAASNLTKDEYELLDIFKQLNEKNQGRVMERAEVLLEQSKRVPILKQERINTVSQIPTLEQDEKCIELYELPVSAGRGTYLSGEYKSVCMINAGGITDQASYALRVSGDSMEPEYADGDIVLIEEQDSVEIGDTGIFILNGDGYIKKFGGDRLISLNPDYNDIIIHDYDAICYKGKVLGKLEKVNLILKN